MDNHEPEGQTSATEIVDLGSIPGRVKPTTTKIGNHSFPAWRSDLKGTAKTSQWFVDRWTGGSLTPEPKGSCAVSRPRQLGDSRCQLQLHIIYDGSNKTV